MPSSPRRIPDLDDNNRLDPMTPPPSLVTTYSRSTLLSLATPDLPPPNPLRLQSFTPILRSSISDDEWGVSEDLSTLLDGKPVSDFMPVHRDSKGRSEAAKSSSAGRPVSIRRNSGSPTSSNTSEVLFHFTSVTPSKIKPPQVLVEFSNPFTSQNSLGVGIPIKLGRRKSSASSIFQGFPASVNSSSSSLHIVPNGNLNVIGGARDSMTLGKELGRMRLGRRDSLDPVGSSVSSQSSTSFPGGGLNPFAPPFPPSLANANDYFKPPAKPFTMTHSSSSPISQAPQIPQQVQIQTASLPLPRPSSLPPRPGPLPPVFIKRESAALPQPMALPDVAPLGKEWEGENALSGNEKRRRTSAVGSIGGSISSLSGLDALDNVSARVGTRSRNGSNVSNDGEWGGSPVGKRPERLARLGEQMRESMSRGRAKA
ncbi:hypothetical protein D1P53_002611 [Cryptococcus gattii VGV]|nr:hypothetical protein D1P53_002611 [Cryptococcus gattii VGV]